MPIPQSFIRDGFGPPTKPKFRRMMVGTEGESESGKSEFISSAPGPGIAICLDRNHEVMLENPNPPKSRRSDFAYKIVQVPLETQVTKNEFLAAWQAFKALTYKAIDNQDARTIGIDTDNASWELQQLAEFGKLSQIPPIMRTGVNAARRAFIARLADSGKNIIATNMLKNEYETVIDENTGKPLLTRDGKEQQVKTGERVRQGFNDQDYLWHVQIRHLVNPATKAKVIKLGNKEIKQGKDSPVRYGLKVLKCKRNANIVGQELWGVDCNFAGLVKLIYPEYPLSDWGF